MGIRPRSVALSVAGVLGLTLLAWSPPVSAMSESAQFDGGDHPGVVAMLAVTADNDRAFMYCSGMAIDDTVILTASHCNAVVDDAWFQQGGYRLAVTNDPVLDADSNGWIPVDTIENLSYVKRVWTNPLYRGGYRDDVSAQELEGSLGIDASDFGVLPAEGFLDALQKNKTLKTTDVLVLGYGTEPKTIPANTGPAYADSNERRRAVLPTLALDKQSIHQNQNIARGEAGACYGDSGGPSLIMSGGTMYVVGVTSTGDGPCFATNVAGRVDTATALSFLATVRAAQQP